MSELLDELARSLAKPMPRSRALRLLGGALALAAVRGLRPRAARGAGKGRLDECDAPGRCPGKTTCGIRDPNAGPSPIPVCIVACCDDDHSVCCKWPGYKGSIKQTAGTGSCGQAGFGTVCCCADGSRCGESPASGPCISQVCGPDITDALDDALDRVKAEFGKWSNFARNHACESLVTLPAGAVSWEINQLGPGGREKFAKSYQPECGTCGTSVQVGSDCHYSGSVNYVVYGVMMRLCHDYFSKDDSVFADWFSAEEMQELIYIHKSLNATLTEGANLKASTEWALAGYHSGSVRPTPPGERKECTKCSEPYSGRGLTVRWLPVKLAIGP